jgi:hypothetical protein
MLMTPPKPKKILSPLFGITVFKLIFARADADTSCSKPSFDHVEISWLPKTTVNGVVSEIIAIVEIDQIVSPDITFLSRIVKVGEDVSDLWMCYPHGAIEFSA